ncbi:MAG: alpha/beta hydrolase [Actinobacteria bacterium]|nr:alpha/beta hydrolase [Actinomycetota bacterium]
MRKAASVTLESGLKLSYAEQGTGSAPPVLLLPGPTDSWRSYEPVLDRLPHWIRAIAVSMRGHGDSDKPEGGYGVEAFASDVVEFLNALEIDRAMLVGHSGSCLVARRVALDHPSRVAGLILEASPTSLCTDAARQFVSSVVVGLSDPIDPDFARSFVAETSSESVAPEVVDMLVAETLKVPARVWHAMFLGLLDYDDTSELASVDAPTLLIWGDDDALVSREMQQVLTDRIPHAALSVYHAVGHTPRWDDPQRFSEDLAAFVERPQPGW